MLNRAYWLLASLFLSPLALAANNDVDLGSPGDGPLAAFAGFMQVRISEHRDRPFRLIVTGHFANA
ncbi:hypothetical protein [Pseudomonas aeruginosa]|uniref:hypothetical protein n=1 Tax=Pseudomonas aeruginosa TaxID=287 RepID=UPI003CC6BE84